MLVPDGGAFFASMDRYWHDGEKEFATLPAPTLHTPSFSYVRGVLGPPQFTAYPFGPGVVAWAPGRINQLVFLDTAGRFHSLAQPQSSSVIGLDSQGRLIMQSGRRLFALDPRTGATQHPIYP